MCEPISFSSENQNGPKYVLMRPRHLLSTDNKIFCLERINGRDIRVHILYRSFIEKVRIFFLGYLSFLLSHFIYKCVIKISYIGFERGEDVLSFGKNSFLSALFYRREIGVNILCHYFCIICYFTKVNSKYFIYFTNVNILFILLK